MIGLPGDRIQVIDGVVNINGTPVKRERVTDFVETEEGVREAPVKRWKETLPNGVSFETLDLVDNGFADNTQVYTVPPDNYFMMGDNRDNSTDSRFSQVGFVPFENIVGRAQIIFFSVSRGRAGLAVLALAGRGALEPAVHDRPMSRKAKDRTALEERIGYKFADQAMLERALTHISALSGGPQNRVVELSAPRISRRPRARPGHLRHALSRLSEGERGRAVAPSGRSGAQGNLRRGGEGDGSRACAQAWQFGIACRRPACAAPFWPMSARR